MECKGREGGELEGSDKKPQMKAIRNQYADMGVDAFYKSQGTEYSNPHFRFIARLIRQNEHRIDYSQALDFCCGSGEVSRVLRDMGYTDTQGCDPFTQKAYVQSLNKPCMGYSFHDVIRGGLTGRKYSSILCSFAMHLCPEKKLYPLVQQLFQISPQIVIITPHKRPALELIDGVRLAWEDSTLTDKGKKVRLKNYVLNDH